MQIKNNCHMIVAGLCPETFAFQLFIFFYLFFVNLSNFLKSRLVFLKNTLLFNVFCLFRLAKKFHSLISSELFGFISKTYFHTLGRRLTNICICIDPTFNMSRRIILFVGFLKYFKDAIILSKIYQESTL